MTTRIINNHRLYGKFKVIAHDKGISHHIINNHIWEEHILKLITNFSKRNTVILDIGANIGCHCVGLNKKNMGRNMKVVAFEPQPFVFDILQFNMKNNCANYECYNVGLSDTETKIFLEMPDYTLCENPGGFNLDLQGKDHTKTPIQIKTLDSYNFENVSLIKIDVEGLENQVLKGAYSTILRSKPIMIIEILGGTPFENANKHQKNYILDTIKHIESLNYNVKNISFSDYLCTPKLK